jgi:hypothetical protein
MGNATNIRQIPSAARTRILMICPDCDQENLEFADKLREMSFYSCGGDGCDYRFDLMSGQRKNFIHGLAEAWKKFFAAFVPVS